MNKDLKKCGKCNKYRSLISFYKNKRNKDGKSYTCARCCKIYADANKEKKVEYNREYNEKPENKSKRAKWDKENRLKNKDRIAVTTKLYKQTHKSEIREYNRAYEKEKRKSDPNYKIRSYLRNSASDLLNGRTKGGSFVGDLGCSIEYFKQHIEALFQPGMSWENRGNGPSKWNLDHIAALCFFDLTNREQFLKACHYTNLQPLWYEDHKAKTVEDNNKKRLLK